MAIDKFKQVDIVLDKANDYIIDDQLAKVGDIQGRDLVVQITNAGVVQNQPDIKLTFSWHNKKMGNSGMIDFRPLDSSQGIFIVTFPDAMNNTGNVVATIGVNENGKWTFSRNFIIRVEENAFTASVPLESDDWETLLVALDKVNHLSELTEAQLKEYLEKSKEEWTAFVEANKEIITAIDPGGTLLAEVIDARYDGKKTFTTLRERLNQTISVNTDYFSNYEVIDYFKPEIGRVSAEVDTSKFNVLVNTDAHFTDISGLGKMIVYDGAGKLSLNHFSNTIALSKGVDAVIGGGDQVDGNDLLPASTAKDNSLIARKMMNNSLGADVFMILGNHDTDDKNITNNGTDAKLMNQKLDVVVKESQIKEAYQTKSLRFGETRDGDSLYFYKDYPDKKVRLIGINTSDIGELTTAEGYAKYSRLGTCVIGQRQMNWIANVALMTTPADYHVVMYGHIPLGHDKWSGTLQEAGFTNQKANCDTLGYIIDAFKNGTSIHATNSTAADYPIDVTADFTQRGVGNFVAYFCGHVHHEEIYDFHSFKNVFLLNSLAWTGYNSVPGVTRELGSAKEDAQTVISIDTALRHVNLIGFGSATDRTLTY